MASGTLLVIMHEDLFKLWFFDRGAAELHLSEQLCNRINVASVEERYMRTLDMEVCHALDLEPCFIDRCGKFDVHFDVIVSSKVVDALDSDNTSLFDNCDSITQLLDLTEDV